VYGISGIIGSLMGGFLANPSLFKDVPFLSTRPYLLACLVGFLLAMFGVVMTLKLLEEPKHTGTESPSNRLYDVLMSNDDDKSHPNSPEEMEFGVVSTSFSTSSAIEMQHARSSSKFWPLPLAFARKYCRLMHLFLVDAKRFIGLGATRQAKYSNDNFEMDPMVTFNNYSSDAVGLQDEEDDTLTEPCARVIRKRTESVSTTSTSPAERHETVLTRTAIFLSKPWTSLISGTTSNGKSPFHVLYSIFYPYFSVLSKRTAIPIAMYTLFTFSNSLFQTAFPLLTSSSLARGGYAMGPQQTSIAMAGMAASKIVIKVIYLPIHGILGTLLSFRVGAGLVVPSLILMPLRLGLTAAALAAALADGTGSAALHKTPGAGKALFFADAILNSSTHSIATLIPTETITTFTAGTSSTSTASALVSLDTRDFHASSTHLSLSANASSTDSWPPSPIPLGPLVLLTSMMGLGEGLAYLAVVMVITDSVESSKLGLVHGLGGCLSSVVRTIAPTMAGLIWEWGHGTGTVFWLIIVVVFAEIAISFYVSRGPWRANLVVSKEGCNDYDIDN
jgi:hypothetical protein